MFRTFAVLSLLTILVAAAAFAGDAAASAQNLYFQHNLTSDIPGLADFTDANLVDPWGMSFSATSPFWISNHLKGNSTLYNGSGSPVALVVTIPSGAGGPSPSKPTGQISTNGSTAFQIGGRTASFIFVTEDGTISGFTGATTAVMAVDNSSKGAVYKGLAFGANASGPLLYAANFNSGNIDVFDPKFNAVTVAGGFADPSIPAGFAPFNIWAAGGKLYVMYAKQNAAKNLDVPGPGNGFVNQFDMDGNMIKRIASNGPLNSPFGVAIAPSTFGAFAGALLVGNFGDGAINAFDLTSGNFLGTLQGSNGKPIINQGLWSLNFGNGRNGGDPNILYFCAGITNGDTKVHGLLGSIAPPSTVTAVANGASGAAGAVAPGEVIELGGIAIGPSPLVAAKFPLTGTLDKTLAVTSVTVNNAPAPIVYASASVTSIIVPYSVAGSTTANIAVTFRDQTTAAFQVNVAPSAPGIFTSNAGGTGQAVAFNQDGTVNSSKNPAAKGSVVAIFGTGEGQTDPPGQDGLITGDILRIPLLPVTVTIGGQSAQVLYAGSTPGLASGVLEVEVVVPSGAGSGDVPVVLTIGGASSQKNVTINVQ